MSQQSKLEYLHEIKDRYKNSSKKEKQKILDEFCKICCYNRKYAIRLLNSAFNKTNVKKTSPRGRKKQYDNPLIVDVIHDIWVKTNLPCSKRLKVLIELWLPYYDYELPQEVIEKIKTISAATIDRLIKPYRSKFNKTGLATTKPGSILKKHIPIKTNQWDETTPGFIEADTVAHCGSSTEGTYVNTINAVDIATSWTEQRAVWGKGEHGVLEAL